MPVSMEERVRKAFKRLGPKNPLSDLGAFEKRMLFSLVVIYAGDKEFDREKRRPSESQKLEEMAATAASLAKKLQKQIFEGSLSEPLRPFVKGFQDVPPRLRVLALRLQSILRVTAGKPGQTRKMGLTKSLLWLLSSCG